MVGFNERKIPTFHTIYENNNEITSDELASLTGISRNNASKRLSHYWMWGYLKRRKGANRFYIYSLNYKGKKRIGVN